MIHKTSALLKKENLKIFIYEPLIKEDFIDGIKVLNNFDEFINNSDIIVANRIGEKIEKYRNKVFTRDIFKQN